MFKYYLIVFLLLNAIACRAASTKDETTKPISREEFTTSVAALSASSEANAVAIKRAYVSGLAEEAYEHYTLLWERDPKDPYANLWRATAAQQYWYDHFIIKNQVDSLAQRLPGIALSNGAIAAQMMPNSSIANREYGYLLLTFGDKNQAMHYLTAALSLDHNSAATHSALGDLLSNPYYANHDASKAERELKKAILLDPTSSYAYANLVALYALQKRWRDAQGALDHYDNLLYTDYNQSRLYETYAPWINEELQKTSR